MRENLYYDLSSQEPLSEENCCKFKDWTHKHTQFPFALHPKGFPIFLKPDEILESDEYSQTDPHGVKSGLETAFQKNRLACNQHLIETIATNLSHNPKVLDIGCGEAHITNKIQEILPDAQICGLDHSLSAIITATTNCPIIEFCVANVYHPPYTNGYFDIVVCNNVWEHVSDPIMLLKQIKRITKPHGYLVLSTPNKYRFGNLVRIALGKPPSLMAPNHVTEFSVRQIIEQLNSGGYIVEKVHSDPHEQTKSTLKGLIGYKIVYPILNMCLRMIRSCNRLEMTVFFLARKEHR